MSMPGDNYSESTASAMGGEPARGYVNQDAADGIPVLTERREGKVAHAISRQRAELLGDIQRMIKHDLSAHEQAVMLKRIALFLAYGGAASDTDPKDDPLQSWIGDGLKVDGESAYKLRREAPGFDSGPRTVTVPDWASSAGRIQTGLRHLDEALPSGQRRRTQLAVLDIERGLEELKVWLRDAGVVL